MTRHLDGGTEIPFDCPRCHKKVMTTVREIEAKPNFACPHCGVAFDAKDLRAALKRTDDAIEKLKRDIERQFGG